MAWARIESGTIAEIVERPSSNMSIWVEEPVTEMVEVFEEIEHVTEMEVVDEETGEAEIVTEAETETISSGFRPEPTGEVHLVRTTVSVPRDWEVDPAQMEAWGWVEIEEKDQGPERVPGQVVLRGDKPVRAWEAPPTVPEPPEPTLDTLADGSAPMDERALRLLAREVLANKRARGGP